MGQASQIRSPSLSDAELMLSIDRYPIPTNAWAIDEAVALGASFGGKLNGLAIEVEIPVRVLTALNEKPHAVSQLGDATEHARRAPPCPVLLSH